MNQQEFKSLISERRFGQPKTGQGSGRTLRALKHYLMGGKTVRQACKLAGGLSDAALYNALSKLGQLPRQRQKVKRERCAHCGQALPNNTRARSGTPRNGS